MAAGVQSALESFSVRAYVRAYPREQRPGRLRPVPPWRPTGQMNRQNPQGTHHSPPHPGRSGVNHDLSLKPDWATGRRST